jgi:hypothetical protein
LKLSIIPDWVVEPKKAAAAVARLAMALAVPARSSLPVHLDLAIATLAAQTMGERTVVVHYLKTVGSVNNPRQQGSSHHPSRT